ncbi:MAG: cysteine--tRNA ligase [Nanoarchaeota archaeon]
MVSKGKVYLYNSLTRKKELLVPSKKDTVGFYSCGPTVYWYQHVGNMRAYTAWDVLKRVLEYNGYSVNHVMNYTDVGHLSSDADSGDDKMEKAAKKEGKTAKEIADFYIKDFEQQCSLLNIIPPKHKPRATEYIKKMIDFIKVLEKKGYTYKTSDGIYFDTSKISDYGALIGGINKEELEAGKRVDMGEKKSSTDFALWKFSEKEVSRQQEWPSPWGTGYPGWHIECSVMGHELLGEVIDIHSGGQDHRQIHHPNEMAQNEGFFGHDIVKIWLHNGFLTTPGGDKISKSTGSAGLKTIIELKKDGINPLAVRYLYLSTHYRKPSIFTTETVQAATNSLNSIIANFLEFKKNSKEFSVREKKTKPIIDEFKKTVNDDLNIPNSLAITHNVIKEKGLNDAEKYELIKSFDKVLGLGLEHIKIESIPKEIIAMAQEREEARKNKDWKKSDLLRNKIKKEGYTIEDSPEGYKIIK